MPASGPHRTYVVRQLQTWDEHGWAVIALPAGAIALLDDKLLMKLSKAEAERIAAEFNGARDAEGSR